MTSNLSPDNTSVIQPDQDSDDMAVHWVPEDEAKDIAALRTMARDALDEDGAGAEPLISDWAENVLAQWPQFDRVSGIAELTRSYTSYQLRATHGERNFNVEVRVDNHFGDLRDGLRDRTQTMLNHVVQGQTRRFIARARQEGLNRSWRRPRGRRFPHVLPYLNRGK